ncbi:transporter substrate-binding domain-containing protein [Methanospirillum lacunae]|uniref:ABC transporter substrate-binding protein n=1 Tax=Methanospirillum lacunae TaxID=668570 RepID=A0A2V2N8L3_9EURY|nr:transporter substrate-binding domain-containing protein [Methanospirillum lacunae]PWR72627.1 ABC transporter substrate-binding protein [Methanospirillum lacunae]
MDPRYLIPVVIILFTASVIGYIQYQSGIDTSLSDHQHNCITIGYAVEPPYAYVSGINITGESPEVAQRIVEKLGIPCVTWRQTEFGSLISELEAGRIDVIAAGMFITDERLKRISFSSPSFKVNQGLLVKSGNPSDIHSYKEAVDKKDVIISVLAGSVEQTAFLELGMPEERLIMVPDTPTGRSSVETGYSTGFALSTPSIRWLASHSPPGVVEEAQPFVQSDIPGLKSYGYGAFGFRKEDKTLLSAWNNAMKEYIGSDNHLDLVRRFGVLRDEMPEKEFLLYLSR